MALQNDVRVCAAHQFYSDVQFYETATSFPQKNLLVSFS
jgi:hypothetical protein